MNKKEAYKIVFNDLKNCNLFKGIYNAKNGNKHFMNGIGCVMENISYNAGFDNFGNIFIENLIKSEKQLER